MQDLLQQVLFYVFAGLTVFSALMVITQNNPVRCVLFLVFAFILSSGLWMLLRAEFLSLILVLVYVGAVMTLFLFVVMMLNIDIESSKTHVIKYLPFGLILVALLVALLLKALPNGLFTTAAATNQADLLTTNSISNTETLGMVLYTDYVFAFELAAIILLVAIVAAITLAHRKPRACKQQNVTKQIMTRREDRVQLVKMHSEK